MSGDPDRRAALALIVGVGKYRRDDRIPALPCAVADAESVAKALIDPAICRFPESGVRLLVDVGATREEVVRGLSKWLPEAGRGAEIVVIYFACHGMMHGSGLESAFLLPHDADPEDLVTLGIEMSDLSRWIGLIDARAVVLCLDCCHSGKVIARHVEPDRPTLRDVGLRPSVLEELSVTDPTGKAIFVIAACDDGQRSHEVPDLGHGLFTHHLLRGIAGEGDRDGDGHVGISELFEHVAEAVAREARQKFQVVQKPRFSTNGSGRVFISSIAPRRDPTPSLIELRRHPVEVSGEARILDFERRFDAADEEELIRGLRDLGGLPNPRRFPAIFRCLAHPREAVRERAGAVIDSIGWPETARGVESLARKLDEERVGHLLDGLKAFRSHPDLVTLLDRLVERLNGALRDRAILLVERKRLVLDQHTITDLFRERKSPYRIASVLGQGLFAAAYLAHDERHEDMNVVVRILRREFVHQPRVRAEFVSRSLHWVQLDHHQNLVATLEVGDFRDREVFYSVRKHVDGVTLQSMLDAGRRFEPSEVLSILRQGVAALVPLHEAGIVHGGIKPANLFISKKGRVILGDPALLVPGIALSFDRLSYDYRYASPEQFEGSGTLVPASDYYSMGCVAYELLCKSPPHAADNHFDLAAKHKSGRIDSPASRGRSMGPAGDALLSRFLARNPADRPADAESVVIEIDLLRHSMRGPGQGSRPPVSTLGSSIDRYRDVQSLVGFGTGGAGPPDAAASLLEQTLSPFGKDRPAMPAPEAGPPAFPGSTDHQIHEQEGSGSMVGRPSNSTVERPWELPGGTASPDGSAGAAPSPVDRASHSKPFEPRFPASFGRYNLLRTLGEGGMGTVYLAFDTHLNRKVALKVPHPHQLRHSSARERFLREARAAASFHHPNFCPIYEIGEIEGRQYLAMAYIEGKTLARTITPGEKWPLRQAAELVRTLAQALGDAHRRGIIHRDLKPSNVMLDPRGTPIIMDFGLARMEESEDNNMITASGDIVGTPAYMPPEQAEGDQKAIGPESDLYSLSVILYELLTSHRPFDGPFTSILLKIVNSEPPAPSSFRPEIDPRLEAICLTGMAKSPKDRFDSMYEFAYALESWLDSDGPADRTSKPSEVDWHDRRADETQGGRAIRSDPSSGPPGEQVPVDLQPEPDPDRRASRAIRPSTIVTGAAVLAGMALLCYFIFWWFFHEPR